MQGLSIGKIAARAEVGIDTVRFYERSGLLPKPERTASGYRLYHPDAAERLRFIRRAKALGFTLDEIRELLALNDSKGRRPAVREIAQRRLSEVEQKLSELTRIRKTLQQLLHECHGDGPLSGCPIIESIAEPACHAEPTARRSRPRNC